ncbi:MAG: InlB B-repeat-containing protein, partial [Lachnospiraceae bacterium]|nr:InlB B-repeat-containing protein [Lachnospiraceae bacterium]
NGHGPAPTAQTVAYGAKATTPTAPTETGYTFGGWYREASCTNAWTFDTDTVTGDTTLYAKWTINKYNVTFVDEDGTTVLKAATAYDYGTAASGIVQPTTPTKAATAQHTYTFAGWTPAIADVGATDQTYTATYNETVNQYTITWKDGNGGTLKTDTVAYGVTPSYSGSTPTKTATAQYTYTFNDTWSPTVTAVTGAATYTAQFAQTVNNYTVTFDANGHGTAPTAQTVAYGAKATTPAAPAETGYTFGGWYKEAACTNAWKFDTDTVTEDTTLYAKWTVNKYNVTFVDEDGTTVLKAATAYDYGTAAADIVQPTTPTKAATVQYRFDFVGWMPALADVTRDAIYQASYGENPNVFSISYSLDGGRNANENPSSYVYGIGVAAFQKASRPGYDFEGWFLDETYTQPIQSISNTATGNLTLYAKFVEAEDDSDEEEEEDRPQPTAAAEVPKSPKTGDEGQNINWLFIGLMACVISYRRRISKCHW